MTATEARTDVAKPDPWTPKTRGQPQPPAAGARARSHGVDKAAPSPVGFHCLEWRIGSGSAAGEVGTEQENVVIH